MKKKYKYAIVMDLESITEFKESKKLIFIEQLVNLGFEHMYNGFFLSNTETSNNPVYCVMEMQKMVLSYPWLKNLNVKLMKIENIDSLNVAFDV